MINQDNTLLYKIGTFILAGVLIGGTMIYFVTRNTTFNQNATTISNSKVDASHHAMENRRLMALEVNKILSQKYNNILVTVSGNENEIMTVTAKTLDDKIIKEAQKNSGMILEKCRQVGFKELVLDNTRQQWKIKI